MILPVSFYTRDDVVAISRELLGKKLCTNINGGRAVAIISETEAYAGVDDKASHAYGGKRTFRTEPMFAEGGISYVYLCYGIHHLFNVVTNVQGTPHAVLIRAAIPVDNVRMMQKRRGRKMANDVVLAGPGILSRALGITTRLTGASLQSKQVWIEESGILPVDIVVGPRVGVGYAGNDASRPYRFIGKFKSAAQRSADGN
jgi:DNA-3-methyladenine glycosylase